MAVEIDVGLSNRFDEIPGKFKAAQDAMRPFADLIDKMKASATEMSRAILNANEAAAKSAERSADRQTAAADAAARKSEAAAKRAAEAERKQREELARLADQAELTATRLAANGRSQELLIKIGGQYATILREAGQAGSELEKTWRAGLSPAENSARKLVELSAKLDDVKLSSEAAAIATGELSDRMADQIRRQDTNVGSQNKLSRSLSELIDELKTAQKSTLAVALVQAQQAESSAQVTLELRKLAFETNDADKESEQYKNTVAALQKRIEGLSIQEQKAKLATEQSAEAYGQSKQRLDALETAMSALGIPGANLVQRGKEIADSLETMSEKGKKGETQLLKIAIGAGIAIASVAALAAGFVAVTAKAAEWDAELGKVGLQLDKMSSQRLKDNAAALQSVVTSGQALAVSLASVVGPGVAYVADGFTILNLALRDGWSKDLPAYGAEAEKLNQRLANQIDLQERLKQQREEQAAQLGMLLDQQKREYDFSRSLEQRIREEQTSRLTGEAKILAERDKRLSSLQQEFQAVYQYSSKGADVVAQYERLKAEIVKTAETQIREERKTSAKEAERSIEALKKRHEESLPVMMSTADVIDRVVKANKDYADQLGRVRQNLEQATPATIDYSAQVDDTTQALNAAAEAAQVTADKVSSIFSNVGLGGVSRVIGAFEQIQKAQSGINKAMALSGAMGMGLNTTLAIIDKIITQATGSGLMDLISGNGANTGKVLSNALGSIDWTGIMTGAVEGFIGALGALDNSTLWNKIADGLAQAVNMFASRGVPAIVNVAVTIIKAIAENLDVLLPALINAGVQIAVGIAIAAPQIAIAIAEGLVKALVKGVGEAFALFLEAIGLEDKAAKVRASLAGPAPTQGGTGQATTSAGYKEPMGEPAELPVTDAYIPSSASKRTIRTTPGDSAYVYQEGGSGDPAMIGRDILGVLSDILGEIRDQNAILKANNTGMRGARPSYTTMPRYAMGIGR